MRNLAYSDEANRDAFAGGWRRSAEEEEGNREIGGWASRAMRQPTPKAHLFGVALPRVGCDMARGATPSTFRLRRGSRGRSSAGAHGGRPSALRKIRGQMNNRPTWLAIPLRGVLALLGWGVPRDQWAVSPDDRAVSSFVRLAATEN